MYYVGILYNCIRNAKIIINLVLLFVSFKSVLYVCIFDINHRLYIVSLAHDSRNQTLYLKRITIINILWSILN